MDTSSSKWSTDMETMNTDHVFFHHCQTMNQFDHSSFYNNPNFSTCTYPSTIEAYSQAAGILEENLAVFFSTPRMETQQNSSNFSSPPNVISFSNSPIATTAAPKYFENLNASVKSEVPSSRTTINFSSSAISIYSDFEDSQHTIQELGFDTQKKSCSIRTGLQAQGHVLAERKRRQQLSQRIIALSALIPDLKKLDKASVLGDAIKYIKQLKERVKTLEEKSKKCSNKEPVVTVKRARLLSNYDDSIFSDENSNISTERSSFPDIEVRASAENVLINIYCNKQSARIKEIFSQVENLNLNIISSSAMPIGDNITNITIIAQMDYQWSMTAQHDANRIHGAIMKLISGQEEAALLHHKEFQDF